MAPLANLIQQLGNYSIAQRLEASRRLHTPYCPPEYLGQPIDLVYTACIQNGYIENDSSKEISNRSKWIQITEGLKRAYPEAQKDIRPDNIDLQITDPLVVIPPFIYASVAWGFALILTTITTHVALHPSIPKQKLDIIINSLLGIGYTSAATLFLGIMFYETLKNTTRETLELNKDNMTGDHTYDFYMGHLIDETKL